jgi:hypothetical protein
LPDCANAGKQSNNRLISSPLIVQAFQHRLLENMQFLSQNKSRDAGSADGFQGGVWQDNLIAI